MPATSPVINVEILSCDAVLPSLEDQRVGFDESTKSTVANAEECQIASSFHYGISQARWKKGISTPVPCREVSKHDFDTLSKNPSGLVEFENYRLRTN